MIKFDAGRDPSIYPDPKAMSDRELYSEWDKVQSDWSQLCTAEKAIRSASIAAAEMALLSLPGHVRGLFDGLDEGLVIRPAWSLAATALSNRFSDLEEEWLIRERRQKAA